MCEPTTLLATSLALSVAENAAQVAGEAQQAKAQTAYQQKLVAANNTETGNQLSRLRIEQSQSREAATRESEKARLASQAAKSRAAVAAGEAGVQGQSVDALLSEYDANLGRFKEADLRQRQLNDASYADKAAAISAGANYQNLQINAPVVGPNYGAAALRIGGSALSAYRSYNPSAFKK